MTWPRRSVWLRPHCEAARQIAPLRPIWQQMLNSRKMRRPVSGIEAIVEAEIVHGAGRLPQRGDFILQIVSGAARFEQFVAERIAALQILGDDAALLYRSAGAPRRA